MGERTRRREHSARTYLAEMFWIPTVLCMWIAQGCITTSAAQLAGSAPARQSAHASVDAPQRMRFLANGSTLEVFDAEAGTLLSSIAIPERIGFCQFVGDVLLVALQTHGVAVVDLRDWRRPRRQADIATDTVIARIDVAQRVAALHSRDGISTLEYDLSSPQAPRLQQTVRQAARSVTAAGACEHRSSPDNAEQVTMTATLRVITKRDGTQVMGQVLKVVPHEPVTVRTASHEDVVIAWDDIRRIEDLRSGPALALEPVHQRPFEPLHIGSLPKQVTDPDPPPKSNQDRIAAIVMVSVLGGALAIAVPTVALYFAFKDRSFFGNIGLY